MVGFCLGSAPQPARLLSSRSSEAPTHPLVLLLPAVDALANGTLIVSISSCVFLALEFQDRGARFKVKRFNCRALRHGHLLTASRCTTVGPFGEAVHPFRLGSLRNAEMSFTDSVIMELIVRLPSSGTSRTSSIRHIAEASFTKITTAKGHYKESLPAIRLFFANVINQNAHLWLNAAPNQVTETQIEVGRAEYRRVQHMRPSTAAGSFSYVERLVRAWIYICVDVEPMRKHSFSRLWSCRRFEIATSHAARDRSTCLRASSRRCLQTLHQPRPDSEAR